MVVLQSGQDDEILILASALTPDAELQIIQQPQILRFIPFHTNDEQVR